MKQIVVSVADMKVSRQPGDVIVTHALGSCLGITLYDPEIKAGGMLHVMLPTGKVAPEKAENRPLMFVDTAVPMFFKQAYALGAVKQRLIVKVAGGSALSQGEDFFNIGQRNILMLRKLLWKNGMMIAAEDVGGHISRTLYLQLETGRTWLHSHGEEWEL